MPKTSCDRCTFGKIRPGTERRTFILDGTTYTYNLCDDHAALFDRELGAWALLASDVLVLGLGLAPPQARPRKAGREATVRIREVQARARQLHQQQQERVAAELAATLSPVASGHHAWRLSVRAHERADDHGFTAAEVLETALFPDLTYPQPERGAGIYEHRRGKCRVIVDRESRLVITVMEGADTDPAFEKIAQ